ncbi:MAG: hypothetical protein QOK22_2372 [Gaiellaceae bacterium]|jgi:hypothetical protein|nr:hypothetical protein [Gaiellaceae bacterium]
MQTIPHPTSRRRAAGAGALVLTLASVLLVAAGCGGGPAGSAVANVGATTTGSSGTQPTQSSGSGSGKPDNGRAFSACMRRNGVPSFPDPSKDGGITINGDRGVNPDSSQFKAAQTKCQKLLPNGGQGSPAEQAKMQDEALKYSACMRSHGVPKFPDPQFSAGSTRIKIGGNGVDPRSPAFQAAQKACASALPGLKTQNGGAAQGNGKMGSGLSIRNGSAGAP